MTDRKHRRAGTREAVETAIELTKQDKLASWDELVTRDQRARLGDVKERVPGPAHPVPSPLALRGVERWRERDSEHARLAR